MRIVRLAAAAILVSFVMSVPVAASAAAPSDGCSRWIVRTTDRLTAERSARTLGGRDLIDLPVIDGFAVALGGKAVSALRQAPGVAGLICDGPVRFLAAGYDGGSLQTTHPLTTGAASAWSSDVTGDGVTVALIDTGVSPHPDLAGSDIVVVDFSGEGRPDDGYGHGTYTAGLIGGQGSLSAGAYVGMAPDARLVMVKVAGSDGSTDVTRVLAAMSWILHHRHELGIRVVNMAFGTDGTQDYLVDPLVYGVERLWDAGLVVVTAAGNRGPSPSTINAPAYDPLVITAGAADERGTADPRDDVVAEYSSTGPTLDGRVKPDLVAPGSHLVSLRVPGSTIDVENPSARRGDGYFIGSGTSGSAALVSGAAALLLEAHPDWTNDQVKFALARGAHSLAGAGRDAQGAGELDVLAAIALDPDKKDASQRDVQRSDGSGSLESSRGSRHVLTADGEVRGEGWSASSWSASSWSASSWSASSWSASSWSASSWSASSWSASSWSASSWSASSWS